MYKGLVNALYLMNIIFQSFFNLLTPIGIGLLVSYLLTSYTGAPAWTWALLTVFGVIVGLFSMIKFILSAMAALDRLEKEQKERAALKKAEKDFPISAGKQNENHDEKGTLENDDN